MGLFMDFSDSKHEKGEVQQEEQNNREQKN